MSTAIRHEQQSNQMRQTKVTATTTTTQPLKPLFNAEKLIAEFRGQVGVRVPTPENRRPTRRRDLVEDTRIE